MLCTSDQNSPFIRFYLIDGLPTGLRQIIHAQSADRFWRAAITWQIDSDAAIPCREVRHLIDPAGLVHRIRVHERHNGASSPRTFVVQWSIDVSCQVAPPSSAKATQSLYASYVPQ